MFMYFQQSKCCLIRPSGCIVSNKMRVEDKIKVLLICICIDVAGPSPLQEMLTNEILIMCYWWEYMTAAQKSLDIPLHSLFFIFKSSKHTTIGDMGTIKKYLY